MSQPPILPPLQGQASAPSMHQHMQHHYAPSTMNGAQIHHHQPQPPQNPYIPVYPEATSQSQLQHQHQHQQSQQPAPTQFYSHPLPNGNAIAQPHFATLPAQQMIARQMSGGRQKKEIKRRTKTGCLTCRKRRIKCDEGHPTCRNCSKSKRECLGYDPIFKSQGTPAAIQPAPGSTPTMRHQPSSSAAPPPYNPSAQSHPPLASAAYPPQSSATATLPQPQSGTAPVGIAPQPPEPGYEYSAALDPSLATGHPAGDPMAPTTYTTTLLPHRPLKHVPISDLFLDANISSSPFPSLQESQPISDQDMSEMEAMYNQQYAPGLDGFFETTWYSTRGQTSLRADQTTAHYLRYCVERFKRPPESSEDFQILSALEARLVWVLASLPRAVAQHQQQQPAQDQQIHDVLGRLETIEALITGAILPTERTLPPPRSPTPPQTEQLAHTTHQQHAFWHALSTFTAQNDSIHSPQTLSSITDSLSTMRSILSMLENRDVLYSMAIARHYGGRAAAYDADRVLVSSSADPEDAISKLVVAMRFLASEEANGTTQVVQRLCGMCRNGWGRGRGTGGEEREDVNGSSHLTNGLHVKQENEERGRGDAVVDCKGGLADGQQDGRETRLELLEQSGDTSMS